MAPDRSRGLESSAVAISFWLGGLGLTLLKGIAYWLTQSKLIRASMFESLGDVLSGAIMALTQAKINNTRDTHLYPVGKWRLTPLGILFFCAFATSTMVSLAIESLQELTVPEEIEEEDNDNMLRRLFQEEPRLRRAMPSDKIEALILKYSGGQESSTDYMTGQQKAVLFFLVCIVAKGICLTWCKFVTKRTGSDIAKTLAMDHFNDVISNMACLGILYLVSSLKAQGRAGPLVAKIDPAASLILSLWIVYGWLGLALEQVTRLSNRRADIDVVEAVSKTARRSLRGGPLEFCRADVYHSGEGYEASLDVRLRTRPAPFNPGELTTAFAELDSAVRAEEGTEIREVHARLRPQASSNNPVQGDKPRVQTDFSWASGYSALAQPPAQSEQKQPPGQLQQTPPPEQLLDHR